MGVGGEVGVIEPPTEWVGAESKEQLRECGREKGVGGVRREFLQSWVVGVGEGREGEG
ncbi:hypothetical protein FH972_015159 [Carpinus fangiana]|uniref:Uncharacterized protein n=1 Tax=Carpinus fangiana TaxID=176857 RepID=A0A5N6RBY2_9ROSI|nr:hypothetical protein FH972_015159 [Carpinus fangiana]